MKKVHFLDTVKIYYYNKDKPIQKSIQKKVKTTKLYNLENNSGNYNIVIMILVILSVIYIIIMG